MSSVVPRPAPGLVPGAGRAPWASPTSPPLRAEAWAGADRSSAFPSAATPTDLPGGAEIGSVVLDDPDVVDEHRIRRSRLRRAVGRGSTAPWPGPTWRTAAAGLLLAVVALGGTAVGSVVQRNLPTAAAGSKAGASTGATDGTRRTGAGESPAGGSAAHRSPAAANGTSADGAEDGATGGSDGSTGEAPGAAAASPTPYVPWLAPRETGQSPGSDQATR